MRQKLLAGVVGAAVLLGGAGIFVFSAGNSDDPFAKCRRDKNATGTAEIGGAFSLINHSGNLVTDTDVITAPSLVYFGFTNCPDICPIDNARNIAAVEILAEDNIAVTPIFITVDPDRDTPKVLAEYVEAWHPDMIGLTGDIDQITAVSKTYKTYFKINTPDPGHGHDEDQDADHEHDYLVDHLGFTYLVMPGTGFAEFFRREVTPALMAKSVSCFAST